MFRIGSVLLIPCFAGLMVSCGMMGPEHPTTAQVPEVPAQFRPGGAGAGEETARITIDSPEDVTPERVSRIQARERDLVWTDPDNPETELEGLEEVMAEAKRRGPWQVSFTEARRTAVREGKPMLIWFTNSFPGRSPICQRLSAEVFSKHDFGDWAEENIVRLRLDFNVKGESRGPNESAMDDRARKLDYLEKLKKRYKVLGLPMVVLVSPDGTVVASYRGFTRTYGDFYLQRLKNDTAVALKHHEEWKISMGRRGYREWSDAQGRTVFAKLSRYSGGELILVEPDGKRLRTRESSLSQDDQRWLEEEKAKRGR